MSNSNRRTAVALLCAAGTIFGVPALVDAAPSIGTGTTASAILGLQSLVGNTPAPAMTGVHLAISTSMQPITSRSVITDKGTATGSPIGTGRITLNYMLHQKMGTAKVTFTITNAHGSITGDATTRYSSPAWFLVFTGSARITSGTGAYAGMIGAPLEFNALHNIPKKVERVEIEGAVIRLPQ